VVSLAAQQWMKHVLDQVVGIAHKRQEQHKLDWNAHGLVAPGTDALSKLTAAAGRTSAMSGFSNPEAGDPPRVRFVVTSDPQKLLDLEKKQEDDLSKRLREEAEQRAISEAKAATDRQRKEQRSAGAGGNGVDDDPERSAADKERERHQATLAKEMDRQGQDRANWSAIKALDTIGVHIAGRSFRRSTAGGAPSAAGAVAGSAGVTRYEDSMQLSSCYLYAIEKSVMLNHVIPYAFATLRMQFCCRGSQS